MYPIDYEADFNPTPNRWTTFFRIILAIPWLIVAIFWEILAVFTHIFAWVAVVIVNLHLSHSGAGSRAEAELRTTVALADELADSGDAIVLAGDFNLTASSEGMQKLVADGYSPPPGAGIDHVLVKGATATALTVWPVERRTVNGRVLSDHPPVELQIV